MLKFFFIILFSGCTVVKQGCINETVFKKTEVSFLSYQYFLPELPYWAQNSSQGMCRYSYSVRFLNIKKVRENFDLSFAQTLHLQALFNRRIQDGYSLASKKVMLFAQEDKIFFDSVDRIKALFLPINLPTYKRVHLIWVDPMVKNGRIPPAMIKRFTTEKMLKGHPVFFSFCQSMDSLQSIIDVSGLEKFNIRKIPFEYLSPYSEETGELTKTLEIPLRSLFLKKQNIILSIPEGVNNPLTGFNNVQYF